MHQEITKREKMSPIKVLIFIILCAIFLTIFNFFANRLSLNTSIIDGTTLLIATILAYAVIKKFITSYKYMLIGDEFIIQEITGSKEKILLNININQITKLQPITTDEYIIDKKQKYFTKRKMNKKLKKQEIYYCIYEEDDKINFLEIQPSQNLINLIKDKLKLSNC
ncbi:MAG: hypothetical protein N4A50_05480 [Vallitalea sp.]|nr:hypothetical protein [Vallitalea sp.]